MRAARTSLQEQTPTPEPGSTQPIQQAEEAAKAAKNLADAQAAAANAQQATAIAQLAALKAMIGEVPASGYNGTVDLKEKAGSTEAALLAAKAINSAARNIVDRLPQQNTRKTVFLYASGDVPTFQALIAFRAQIAIVNKAFDDAKLASEKAGEVSQPPTEKILPVLGASGLALSAVNNLLGYFRTDYTVGGIDLQWDDSMIVHALAGAIAGSSKNLDVKLPALYNPGALSEPAALILNAATGVSLQRLDGQAQESREESLSGHFTTLAAKEADATKKANLQKSARAHKDAADAWKAALALCDSFFVKLTTADDKGVIPLTNVVRDNVVASALDQNNLLLVVKLQKSGGAYYTKKNMWTLFGGMPLYHMGGAVVSYVLLDGKEGQILQAGVVPIDGGFVKAGNLARFVNGEDTRGASKAAPQTNP